MVEGRVGQGCELSEHLFGAGCESWRVVPSKRNPTDLKVGGGRGRRNKVSQ